MACWLPAPQPAPSPAEGNKARHAYAVIDGTLIPAIEEMANEPVDVDVIDPRRRPSPSATKDFPAPLGP